MTSRSNRKSVKKRTGENLLPHLLYRRGIFKAVFILHTIVSAPKRELRHISLAFRRASAIFARGRTDAPFRPWVPTLSRACRPGHRNVKNRWQSLTGQRKFIPLRIPFIILGLILAVRTLSAKDPPKPAPTPDPALDLSPAQDQQIQRINDLFAKNEGPLSDALKKARDEYKRAINAHPVDEELVSEKAAAARKAATLLATAQALHRANVLILLTPAQRRMVDTLEVTGKVPGTERDKKSTDQGH